MIMDVHLSTSQLLYIYNQLYTCRYAQKMYVKYNTDTLNRNYLHTIVVRQLRPTRSHYLLVTIETI